MYVCMHVYQCMYNNVYMYNNVCMFPCIYSPFIHSFVCVSLYFLFIFCLIEEINK